MASRLRQTSKNMRLAAVLVALLVPSVASAEAVYSDTVSVGPATEIEDAGLGMWGAGYVSQNVYVGGEITAESYDADEAFSVSYHALVGARAKVSPRVAVLADVGAGITQHVSFELGLFGSEGGFDTEGVLPSGAVRVHLVGELGKVNDTSIALGLQSEARSTLEGHAGVGVGIGLYLTR